MSAPAPWINGGAAAGFSTASTTLYGGAVNGCATPQRNQSASEAPMQVAAAVAGTLSNYNLNVTTNGRTTDTVFAVRKNGSNILSITYTSGQTGQKEDASQATIAQDDLISGSATNGTGTGTCSASVSGLRFTPASGNTSSCIGGTIGGGTTVSGTSTRTNMCLASEAQASTTEANAQINVPLACTMKYLQAYVSSNARGDSVVCTLRKNGSNVNQTFTYTAGQTGLKKDTSGTDVIAADDKVCVDIAVGAGSGNIVFNMSAVWFTATTDGQSFTGTVIPGTNSYSGGAPRDRFGQIGGRFVAQPTETNISAVIGTGAIASKQWVYCSGNSTAVDSPFRMRKSAANGNQLSTITAATTGGFQDNTNTDIFTNSDVIANTVVPGDSSALTLTAWSYRLTTLAGAGAVNDPNDTCSSAGTITGGLTATAAISDPNDTCSSAAQLQITGTVGTSDPNDTCSSAATLQITGTVGASDPNDTCSSAGNLVIGGSVGITDPNDTCTSAASLVITGACAITDPNDLCGATGTAGGNAGSAGMTDPNETVSAAGNLIIGGAVGCTDPNDTVSCAASLVIAGFGAVNDPNDTCHSAASLVNSAGAAISDPNDTCSSAAQIQVTGAAGMIDPNDTVVSSARFAGTGPNPRRFIVARRRATGRTAHRRITSKTAG